MKRLAFMLLVALCVPLAAAAQQPGHIGIYGDPQATQCYIEDTFPQTIQAYVVHALHSGVTGGGFTVSESDGFTGVFLGDIEADGMVKIGSAPTGAQIGYGACYNGPVHVLTVTYHLDGKSGPCSYLEITGTTSGKLSGVLSVDCHFEAGYAQGGRALVNARPDCHCLAAGSQTPVEQSTWGGIKNMYRGR